MIRFAASVCLFFTFIYAAHAGIFDSSPGSAQHESETPLEFQRGAEQTYLTFPEWFLVFSPDEYASYVKTHTPTRFPFLCHIQQFWQSYAEVYQATRNDYPLNPGYHIMIAVIGISTTVEYGLRAIYETTLGRLSELSQSGGLTAEDQYGAKVAQEYVDFIRVRPWYEFDFKSKLIGIWTDTPFFGRDMIRKLERKYALTTEYTIKAIYGWLIGMATGATYDPASDTTVVVLGNVPDNINTKLPKFKQLKVLPGNHILAEIPRYHAFMNYAATLSRLDVSFHEISGNRGALLISAQCSGSTCTLPENTKLLFAQILPTQPDVKRYVLTAAVSSLAQTILALEGKGFRLEHIYDY